MLYPSFPRRNPSFPRNPSVRPSVRPQYVHDAYAHVEEDILVHGPGDRNDDAILEKENRRVKRLGDRCVMRGGKNNSRISYKRRKKVAERDERGALTGRTVYLVTKHERKAMDGQAPQVQRLSMIAKIMENKRASASSALSAKAKITMGEAKVERAEKRTGALTSLTNLSAQAKKQKSPEGGADGSHAAADGSDAAAAPDARPASSLTYELIAASTVPADLQQQLSALEQANMGSWCPRNGAPFLDYFAAQHERKPNNLKVLVVRSAGALLAFAIYGADSQRTNFLYELHTKDIPEARGLGIGRTLVRMVQQPEKNKSKKTVLLNVHKANKAAFKFYLHLGFTQGLVEPLVFTMQLAKDKTV